MVTVHGDRRASCHGHAPRRHCARACSAEEACLRRIVRPREHAQMRHSACAAVLRHPATSRLSPQPCSPAPPSCCPWRSLRPSTRGHAQQQSSAAVDYCVLGPPELHPPSGAHQQPPHRCAHCMPPQRDSPAASWLPPSAGSHGVLLLSRGAALQHRYSPHPCAPAVSPPRRSAGIPFAGLARQLYSCRFQPLPGCVLVVYRAHGCLHLLAPVTPLAFLFPSPRLLRASPTARVVAPRPSCRLLTPRQRLR